MEKDVITTKAAIREFIVSNFVFGRDLAVEDGASLIDAGIIDSTGVLELVSFIERKFAIDVADEDIVPENLGSITAIGAYVERCKARNAASA